MRTARRKAISSTMEIIIALVVILVAALVILSIFGIQIGGINQPIKDTQAYAACVTACSQKCLSGAEGPQQLGAACTLPADQYTCDCSTPPGGTR